MKRVREYDSARDGLYRLVAELQDGPRVVGSRSTALPNNYSATPAPGEPVGGGGGVRMTKLWAHFVSAPLNDVPAGTTLGATGAGADLLLTFAEGDGLPTEFSALAFRGQVEVYYDDRRIHYDQGAALSPTFSLDSSTAGTPGVDPMDLIVIKDEISAALGYSGTFHVYVHKLTLE